MADDIWSDIERAYSINHENVEKIARLNTEVAAANIAVMTSQLTSLSLLVPTPVTITDTVEDIAAPGATNPFPPLSS